MKFSSATCFQSLSVVKLSSDATLTDQLSSDLTQNTDARLRLRLPTASTGFSSAQFVLQEYI